jgi:hypothetical protein
MTDGHTTTIDCSEGHSIVSTTRNMSDLTLGPGHDHSQLSEDHCLEHVHGQLQEHLPNN